MSDDTNIKQEPITEEEQEKLFVQALEAMVAWQAEEGKPSPDQAKLKMLSDKVEKLAKVINPYGNIDPSKKSDAAAHKYDFSSYKPENNSEVFSGFIRNKVASVKDKGDIFVVRFAAKTPGNQGAVVPKDLGFKPEEGMSVIYDGQGYIGSSATLIFYEPKSESPLIVLKRAARTLDWTVVNVEEEIAAYNKISTLREKLGGNDNRKEEGPEAPRNPGKGEIGSSLLPNKINEIDPYS